MNVIRKNKMGYNRAAKKCHIPIGTIFRTQRKYANKEGLLPTFSKDIMIRESKYFGLAGKYCQLLFYQLTLKE